MDRQIDKSTLRAATRRRLIKTGIVIAAIIAGVAALLALLEKNVDMSELTLVTVDRGELETTVAASGRVVPAFEEIINSPVTTRVLEVYARPGDSVTEGMPLLALDLAAEQTAYDKMIDNLQIGREEQRRQQLVNDTRLSELEMQIEVKQMQVNRLKIDVDNERKLDSLGSGTGERVRQAETAHAAGVLELKQLRQTLANERRQAEAADRVQSLGNSTIQKDLTQMERMLHQGTVPAPHDGVLTFIVTGIGSQIGAGEKVAVVADLSQFRIEGEVPEGSSDRVSVGAEVNVRIGNADLAGTVVSVMPQAKGGMVPFVVNLQSPRHERLRSGLRVDMSVSYGYKDNVVRLPMGTYFKGPGEYQLFVLSDNNHLERRPVRLGDSNRRYAEVVSGLQPGDRVVISDMGKYETKKKLKIKK